MGGETPKQYLLLNGQPLVWHTLAALCAFPCITQVHIVISAADACWQEYDWSAFDGRLTVWRDGGETRAASVANGLARLADACADDDWVLVHDAARPCLTTQHLAALIDTLYHDAVGGLLAIPVADTLKRVADDGGQRVAATMPRAGLWQAQTPQMFRYRLLREALAGCPDVTDEASAIEAAGHAPRLVQGDITNLKVTFPLDRQLAGWILSQRGDSA